MAGPRLLSLMTSAMMAQTGNSNTIAGKDRAKSKSLFTRLSYARSVLTDGKDEIAYPGEPVTVSVQVFHALSRWPRKITLLG